MPTDEQEIARKKWAARALVAGLACLLVTGPVVFFGVVWTPGTDQSGTADSGAGPDGLFEGLFSEGLHALATGVLTVGLALFLLGSVLFVSGVAYFGRRYVSETSELLFRSRVAIAFWGLLGYTTLYVVDPGVRYVSLEVVRVLLASVSVFGIAVGMVVWGERRADDLMTVVVIGPGVLAAVFLSVIAGMLASATFGNLIVAITDEFVSFLLLNVFTIVGLDTVLTALFDLEGGAYFLVWVGVTVVVGWGLGLVLATYDVSIRDVLRVL